MTEVVEIAPEQRVDLRFFDVDAVIRADDAACIALFERMYGRFQMDAPATTARQTPIVCTVRTIPTDPWGKPVLLLDGEVFPLANPQLLEGYSYERILNTILSRVRSHFLIHAGVVAQRNQGVLLVADAYHGKTTLVLELVRRGFTFLSDEMAALSRADRLVYPFPRSLRIRPGTLDLVGLAHAVAGAPTWMGKLLLDINDLVPGSLGGAVPLTHIVILRDPNKATSAPVTASQRCIGLRVDRVDRSLLAAIQDIDGVTAVRTEMNRGYPLLWVETTSRTRLLARAEELCQERQIALLGAVLPDESRPSFTTPARLTTIPRSRAVMELVQRFLGGHRSALLQEDFGGSPTQLFMNLVATVGAAHCYQLDVGPLHEMADLVSGLVR